MRRQSTITFPNLDGLRFLAFLAVFVSHSMNLIGYDSHLEWFGKFTYYFLLNGDQGVNFFFVLSGFLIVYLLIKEREFSGEVQVGNFYLRRLLRIWPIYYLVLAIALLVLPALHSWLPAGFPLSVKADRLNPWLYVGFAGNFDYLLNGITNLFAGILWSISVEEQFYVFCPWIVALVPPRRLLGVFAGVVAGSLVFRWVFAPGGGMVFKYHSLSSVLFLGTGAVLACLAQRPGFLAWLVNLPRAAIVAGYLIGLGLLPLRRLPWTQSPFDHAIAQTLPLLAAVFYAFVIAEQNFARNSFFKISRWTWGSEQGRRTYGMYCYHLLAFLFVLLALEAAGVRVVQMSTGTFIAVFLGALGLTIWVSDASFRYFESFFLGLKGRYATIVKDEPAPRG